MEHMFHGNISLLETTDLKMLMFDFSLQSTECLNEMKLCKVIYYRYMCTYSVVNVFVAQWFKVTGLSCC